MSRPDKRELQDNGARRDAPLPPEGGGERPPAPSKTRRKAQMHALQHTGEALIALDPQRFAELAADLGLPDRLVEAIAAARAITVWGGRRRQLQYVGRLMRDIDPEPIRRRLDALAQGHGVDAARQRALERWRERLLAEPDALDALAAEYPRLDRPRLRALIAKARDEHERGAPPRAFREIFRELRTLAHDH